MRFVLRSTFWLSIVYASILQPRDVSQLKDSVAQVRTGAASASAAAAAANFCRGRRAGECVDDAARLAELLTATADGRLASQGDLHNKHIAISRHGHDDRLARAP